MRLQSCDAARETYARDGFLVCREPLLPADLVERAVRGMDEIRAGRYETGIPPETSYWNPGDPPDKLCKIEMPQFANRAVMEAVSHPAIGETAGRITGAEWVQVFWVQLLVKPPTASDAPATTNIGWHQDRQYWGIWTPESELLTAWVALSDVTPDSGPMRFVPGSHRWGLLEQGDFYAQNHEAQRAAVRVPEGERWEEVEGTLPPGGVSFHHNLTLHASGPNRSGLPRRSLAIHLRTDRSEPVGGERTGLACFIDDLSRCPVVYRRGSAGDAR
jgi:hypothetical protein